MAQSDEQPQMKIFLKIMKTVALDAHASDTIEDIKAKVCTREGIGANQQELFFSGDHLRNTTRTLADYNIPDSSTINLYIGNGMHISIKIPPSGKTLNLDVKSWDTIERVKAKIKDKEGIPLGRQVLFYLGRPLKDHETLNACNIINDSILQMVLRPISTEELQIFVHMTCGNTITLEVRTWFTVRDVKVMIESMEGVPANQQKLFYAGKNLEDHLTLSEYKITDKSSLQSSIQVQIFVISWTRKTITLMVDEYDTVKMAMEKIESKMGCKLKMHILFSAGKFLEEDRTLGYYNIRSGETVHLKLRMPLSNLSPGLIFVVTKNSGVFSLGVNEKTTVGDVKNMIQGMTNTKLRDLKLSNRGGVELKEDSRPIIRYGIRIYSGDTVLLSFK